MTYEEMKDTAVGTHLWVRMDDHDTPCLSNILEVIFESWDETKDTFGEIDYTFRARSVRETATRKGILFKWLDPERTFVSLKGAVVSTIDSLDYRIEDLQEEREKLMAALKVD